MLRSSARHGACAPARMTKRARERLCRICNKVKPKFVVNNRVKSDPDHDICMRCYRSATSTIEFTANLLPVPPDLVIGAGRLETTRGTPNGRFSDAIGRIGTRRIAKTISENDSTLVSDRCSSTNSKRGA